MSKTTPHWPPGRSPAEVLNIGHLTIAAHEAQLANDAIEFCSEYESGETGESVSLPCEFAGYLFEMWCANCKAKEAALKTLVEARRRLCAALNKIDTKENVMADAFFKIGLGRI